MQNKFSNIYNQILEFFKGNPTLNLLVFVISIFGILLSIYLYIRGNKKKKPIYAIRTINLIREETKKIETLKILFQDEIIRNLSITKIALWNNGRETINSSDLAIKSPLKLIIKGEFEILNAKIIYQKNLANDFKIAISRDKKIIDITFDFFDYEEGIVLEISHTALSSLSISMDGKIKSVRNIIRRENLGIFPKSLIKFIRKQFTKNEFLKIMGVISIFSGIIILFSNYLSIYLSSLKENSDFNSSVTPWLSIPYIVTGYICLKRNIPKGFDIFNEEF